MKRLIWSTTAALALAVPMAATAADGYVTGNVTMRAGPDIGYPYLTTIRAGTEVSIQGCTDGWEWCDVIAYGDRGWVAGDFIQYDYDNERVYLPEYGARIGIPIISFSINTYWGSHYRNRSFYRQRSSWYHRPMPHHAAPRSDHRSPPPRVVPMPHPIHDRYDRHPGNNPAQSSSRDHGSRNGGSHPRPVNNPAPQPRPMVQRAEMPQRAAENHASPAGNAQRAPEQRPPANAHGNDRNPKSDQYEEKRDEDKKDKHEHEHN